MNTKYELTEEFIIVEGSKLFRIKALKSFGKVNSGDLGGFIANEKCLDTNDDAWVFDNAWVSGDAWVFDNAWVSGDAL